MDKPQPLGQFPNPQLYHELIDMPGTEGNHIRQHVIFPYLFAALRRYTPGSGRPVIDYGSGTGSLSRQIQEDTGHPVVGLEPSSGFIKISRQHQPHIQFHRLRPGQAQYKGIGHVNSHLVLHCVADIRKSVQDIAQKTAIKGYAFITVPNPAYFKAAYVHRSSEPVEVKLGGKVDLLYFPHSLEEYEQEFKRAGFEIIESIACTYSGHDNLVPHKYSQESHFSIYILKKRLDVVDTVLLMHRESGKYLVATRTRRDDKFPGVRSFVSARRVTNHSGHKNAAEAVSSRLRLKTIYIEPGAVASIHATDYHAASDQHVLVNLYLGFASGRLDRFNRKYFDRIEAMPAHAIQPFGGSCTKLGAMYLHQSPA